ncbi:hypothetical protein O3P69_006585 [Scylla paramamosain]|uniref:Uncharacterized protein n=1 Tax=Scylla paramamosain TaxID=85552 RepID=A0AAW0U818_SCYPA
MKVLVVLSLAIACSALPTTLVGRSGIIGPSGLIGPSGQVQFQHYANAFFGQDASQGVGAASCITGPGGKICLPRQFA